MNIDSASFTNGIIKDNAVFKQLLGLCPTLAVTTTVLNGLAMGLATTFVIFGANVAVSLFKDIIPSKIRIPAYITIIATMVTIIDLVMNAYFHDLHKVLGLFIPLIVVNCIVLGRAESFASKNNVINSALDGLGCGVGFTISLCVLASVRELIGNGSLFGFDLLGSAYNPVIIFVLPPGAFIALGFLLACYNRIMNTTKEA